MKSALVLGRASLATIAVLALAACGGKADDASRQDATIVAGGDTALSRPKTATPKAPARPVVRAPAAPAERSLGTGTRVSASMQSGLSSRVNKSGELVRANVSSDIRDARGNVVIPAGSTINMTIDKLEPGSDQIRPEGRLMLNVNSVTVNGREYSVNASLDPVPHTMKGRGITTDEAARVAAGRALGAIVGQVIGKIQKGTVIGGAVGAVAGGAVAAKYAYRDIIVAPGAPITITLNQSLTVAAR